MKHLSCKSIHLCMHHLTLTLFDNAARSRHQLHRILESFVCLVVRQSGLTETSHHRLNNMP